MIQRILKLTAPVMIGYIVMGIGFGLLFSELGVNPGYAGAMSIFVYTGALQFLSVGLFLSHASLLTFAIQTFAVSARHLFYGISMVDKFKPIHGLKKFYLMHALSDETYSIEASQDFDNPNAYLLVSFFDQISWVIGCQLGALLGTALPFSTKGVDFMLTALFIEIVVEQWVKAGRGRHIPALTGILASLICLLIFGPDAFLIPSMIVIAAVLLILRPRIEASFVEDGQAETEPAAGMGERLGEAAVTAEGGLREVADCAVDSGEEASHV